MCIYIYIYIIYRPAEAIQSLDLTREDMKMVFARGDDNNNDNDNNDNDDNTNNTTSNNDYTNNDYTNNNTSTTNNTANKKGV